jgi:hypothetical protein
MSGESVNRIRVKILLALTATVVVVGATLFCSRSQLPLQLAVSSAEVWDPDVDGYDEESVSGIASHTDVAVARSFLDRHCVACHVGQKPKGDVTFDHDPLTPGDWAKAAEAIRSGRMPPTRRPRPMAVEEESFLAWADSTGSSRPARVTLRRLNRSEYDNTIRDLVGVAVKPAADFPADDTGDGFDTIGAVLSVSPTLVEKYLAAAETVIEEAAADPVIWQRLTGPPADDFVPFILRGSPPLRDPAEKGTTPAVGDAEFDRAYVVLRSFADRAYRRPVTHAEMARLMRFFETGAADGDGIDAGLRRAMKTVLVSPHFLFKIEAEADGPVTDFELATRLSYFLWSSLPDEGLSRTAAAGKLHDPRTLVAQVRRMLTDLKSRAFVRNFAGQWLQTRALSEVSRDPSRFPEFDADLVQAMREETERFFDHIVRNDRCMVEFLTADYTFVNERLARHYGLSGVSGNDFRRVSLAGTHRVGVLSHASILTLTSGPTRTSPVKRGKWILENILDTSLGAPPPGADTLQAESKQTAASLREQLEVHRARPECASCHARLDPLGFGLENFDSIGLWRDSADALGTLPDGRAFHSPRELADALAANPNEFCRCLVRKLMTYGLGRSLTPADRPAVERIVRHAARTDFRFSGLIIAIVRSEQFQTKGPAVEEAR